MAAIGGIWPGVEWPPGWVVRFIEQTGSTNDDLLAAVQRGEVVDRTALATGHQTAGRGRLGRRWDAPPGASLLVSIYVADVPERPAELTQRLGLAVVDAVERLAPGVPVALKWPNDVLLDGRKLAGILAQRASNGVVIGLGLNVRWAPEGGAHLPGAHQPAAVLAAVLTAYDQLPSDISARYRTRLATIGAAVTVRLPGDRTVTGRAVGVDDDGRLVVLDECGLTHTLDAGDVIHTRPAQ